METEKSELDKVLDSFDNGKKVGIKLVVEWGDKLCPHHLIDSPDGKPMLYLPKRKCDICWWQAFKKGQGDKTLADENKGLYGSIAYRERRQE